MLERYFESMGAFFPECPSLSDKSAKRFIGTSFSYTSVFCFQISFWFFSFLYKFLDIVILFLPSLTLPFYLLSGLRPISALSTNKDSQCNGVSDARPKSGKSLTFHLTQGRHTPALSVSTAEFRYLSSRDLKTPVSVTKVAQ